MSHPAAKILEFLSAYRRSALRVELTLALLGAVGALLLALFVAFLTWLGAERLAWVRTGILLFLAGSGLFFLVRHLILPRLRLAARSSALALKAEGRLGERRLELVSALQFLDFGLAGRPKIKTPAGTSPDLAQAHLERVAKGLKNIRPSTLVDRRKLFMPLIISIFLAVANLLGGLIWPDQYAAAVGGLMSRPDPLVEAQLERGPSWVGDIRLDYRYPAYANREDSRVEGTDGTIMVLPGTQVLLSARSDRPISSGRLLVGSHEVGLTLDSPRQLHGQWVVTEAGAYRFALVSQAGEEWLSARGVPILLERDKRPSVNLSQPGTDRVVRETDTVDMLFDVRDDFGLAEVRLVWRVVGRSEGEQRRTLKRFSGGEHKTSRQTFRWELASLLLRAGEQVQFYIEATDNDTVSGPKTGRSRTISLKVFSADEHHRELMSKVQSLWERMLGGLADHLEQEPQPDPQKEDIERHSKLHQGLRSLLSETNRVIGALDDDRLAWPPLIDALRNTRQGLARQADQLRWVLESSRRRGKVRPIDLQVLANQRSRRIGQQEKDVLYLEDLLDMERLEDLQRIARELDRARERLGQLMNKYKSAPSDEIRRQIEAEIARLKEQMARLMARQSEVLKSVRDEYFNPDAIRKAMSDRDVMSALDRVQALMMEGKVDQAMKELQQIQQKLGQLKQAIDRSRMGFGDQRYKELAKAMGQVQAELNQISQQQKQVAEETRVLRDKAIERLRKRMGAAHKKVLEKLRERLKKMAQRNDQVGDEGLDLYARRDRQRVAEGIKGLDKLLQSGDLARSLEEARELERYAARLSATLEMHQRMNPKVVTEKRTALAQESAGDAQAVVKALEKMLPQGKDLLSGDEPGQVDKLSQRQRELGSRLSQLRSEMEKINKKAPLFGQDMFSGLRRGNQSMRKASDGLGRMDPRSAYPHQQSAMSELEKLQQGMQQSCKGGSGGGGMPLPMGHSGGRSRSGEGHGPGQPNLEKVEIPGEDEYKAPEAFRKELLDGMKDPVPDDYQPQVRRYYEELVK